MARPPDPPEVLERFHSALDLVDAVVRQIRRTLNTRTDVDELTSFGREGLLDAARRYDVERGIPFRAYASFRVRGAVIDGLRASSRVSRRTFARLRALEAAGRVSEGKLEDVVGGAPIGDQAAAAERSLAEHLAGMATAMAIGLVAAPDGSNAAAAVEPGADDAEDPEAAVRRAELLALIRQAMHELPDDERTVLQRHYLDGEPFDVVARELGLSRSWACRLHTRAVGRLGQRLRRSA